MIDYPCGKFDDCSFSRFGSIVRADTQTDTDERFTRAINVGVSNSVYEATNCVCDRIFYCL